jgi:hypothetical protein
MLKPVVGAKKMLKIVLLKSVDGKFEGIGFRRPWSNRQTSLCVTELGDVLLNVTPFWDQDEAGSADAITSKIVKITAFDHGLGKGIDARHAAERSGTGVGHVIIEGGIPVNVDENWVSNDM